jgi:hypothetical protein
MLQIGSLSAANQFACGDLLIAGKVLVIGRGVESLENAPKAGFSLSKFASDLSNGRAGAPDGGYG